MWAELVALYRGDAAAQGGTSSAAAETETEAEAQAASDAERQPAALRTVYTSFPWDEGPTGQTDAPHAPGRRQDVYAVRGGGGDRGQSARHAADRTRRDQRVRRAGPCAAALLGNGTGGAGVRGRDDRAAVPLADKTAGASDTGERKHCGRRVRRTHGPFGRGRDRRAEPKL